MRDDKRNLLDEKLTGVCIKKQPAALTASKSPAVLAAAPSPYSACDRSRRAIPFSRNRLSGDRPRPRVTARAEHSHSAGTACRAIDPAALGGCPEPPIPRVTARAEQAHTTGIARGGTPPGTARGGYPARNCLSGDRPRRPRGLPRATAPACDSLRRQGAYSRNRPRGLPRPRVTARAEHSHSAGTACRARGQKKFFVPY